MQSKKRVFNVLVICVGPILCASTAHATSYKFTVSCEHQRLVVEWRTGAIDPGREALRVSTGSNYPNCSVSNYNHASDSSLPVQVNQGAVGVVQGIPLVGEVIKEVPLVGPVLKGVGKVIDDLF